MYNFTINQGICEGIVVGEVFAPSEDVAIVTVRVRDYRIRPNTQKPTISYIQFTAFDEVAKKMTREVQKDNLVYLTYEITTSKKTDENGVTKFYRNRVVKNFEIFDKPEDKHLIPYINMGIAQGAFVSIKKASKSTGIYFLTIKLTTFDGLKEKVYYPQFTVYGDKFANLFEKYKLDDIISVTYKVETEKKTIDGKEEFFTDYIVTEVK
jgi:single-stranded DNA-binding protein